MKNNRFIYICDKCNNELYSENPYKLKCEICGNEINPREWRNQLKKRPFKITKRNIVFIIFFAIIYLLYGIIKIFGVEIFGY